MNPQAAGALLFVHGAPGATLRVGGAQTQALGVNARIRSAGENLRNIQVRDGTPVSKAPLRVVVAAWRFSPASLKALLGTPAALKGFAHGALEEAAGPSGAAVEGLVLKPATAAEVFGTLYTFVVADVEKHMNQSQKAKVDADLRVVTQSMLHAAGDRILKVQHDGGGITLRTGYLVADIKTGDVRLAAAVRAPGGSATQG